MAWNFDEKSPIYLQIANRVKLQIVSNEITTGSQLPTVRDLSEIAGVNPNTMQRAFASLEAEGMVFSNRTAGRYVTKDEDLIIQARQELAQSELTQFISNMKKMGFSNEEIVTEVASRFKGE